MKLLIFFGNNLNILFTELVLTVIDQAGLKMMMPSLVALTSGMRCTLFHTMRSLGLLHVKPRQNALA